MFVLKKIHTQAMQPKIASTQDSQERPIVYVSGKILIDSGASIHVLSEKDIRDKNAIRNFSKTGIESGLEIGTANGPVRIDKFATIWSEDLQMEFEAVVFKDSPILLSLGALIQDNGFEFQWIQGHGVR